MIYILHNALPILLATVAGFFIGGFMYPPKRADGAPAVTTLGVLLTSFVAELWLCAILAGALILAPPKANGWVMALMTAFIIWIGFIAPVLVVTQRVRAQNWRVVAVDCGHWLAVMLVQAAVLKAIGLVMPMG